MKAPSRFVALFVMLAAGMVAGTELLPLRAGTNELTDPSALGTAAERDVQDFFYLCDKRAVLVRFHVYLDGKPLVDVWDDFMGKLFAFLDRDGDGILSKQEAAHAPPVQVLFNNAPNFVGLRSIAPETLDKNRDGKITRAELGSWYRSIGATPLQLHAVPVHNQLAERPNVNPTQLLSAEALNERLFSLFDADQDGKLSPDELSRAPSILHKFDLDEDERISIQELSDSLAGKEEPLASSPDLAPNRFNINGPLIPLELSENSKELIRSTPDIELRVHLGEKVAQQPGVELVRVKEGPSSLSRSVRRTFGGSLVLELGPTRIELGCNERRIEFRTELHRLRRGYRAQFLKADLDSNGYLDTNEAMQTPLFRNTVRLMDRDGDGKLHEREVVTYLDTMRELQEAAVRSCVTLAVTDQGRGLFDLVDVDKDGRFGSREMRQLASLVVPFDRDGDGFISRREIPHRYRMVVHHGPALLGLPAVESVKIAPLIALDNRTDSPQEVSPVWFQKMDRNRDGEVSHREFLGTEELFRKIDQDGDGYISIKEAKQADQIYRKEKEKKPR